MRGTIAAAMARSKPPDAIAPDGSLIYYRVLDAKRAGLVEVVLPEGGVSKPVHHRTVEEIWYFLDGQGEVWLFDPASNSAHARKVATGDTVVIPTGHHFQFRNLGAGDLRFLCYDSPPWPGDGEAVHVERGGWPVES
jgi:mannose-6-phosphate isomerase-like protein (cupin superfamily)